MCHFPSVLLFLRGVQFQSSLYSSDNIILFGRDKYSHFTIKIDCVQFFLWESENWTWFQHCALGMVGYWLFLCHTDYIWKQDRSIILFLIDISEPNKWGLFVVLDELLSRKCSGVFPRTRNPQLLGQQWKCFCLSDAWPKIKKWI